MSETGFGVIGVGTWGEMHARVYSSFPGARLIAVSDLDEAKGRGVADRHGAACPNVLMSPEYPMPWGGRFRGNDTHAVGANLVFARTS